MLLYNVFNTKCILMGFIDIIAGMLGGGVKK